MRFALLAIAPKGVVTMPVKTGVRSSQRSHRPGAAIADRDAGGLYSAWRLAAADETPGLPRREVKVFEYNSRVGGRPGRPSGWRAQKKPAHAEVGGVRFIPKWQRHINAVIEKLGVLEEDIIDFPVGDDHNLNYLRGEQFRAQSFKYTAVPYRLQGAEQGLDAGASLQPGAHPPARPRASLGLQDGRGSRASRAFQGGRRRPWATSPARGGTRSKKRPQIPLERR